MDLWRKYCAEFGNLIWVWEPLKQRNAKKEIGNQQGIKWLEDILP